MLCRKCNLCPMLEFMNKYIIEVCCVFAFNAQICNHKVTSTIFLTTYIVFLSYLIYSYELQKSISLISRCIRSLFLHRHTHLTKLKFTLFGDLEVFNIPMYSSYIVCRQICNGRKSQHWN